MSFLPKYRVNYYEYSIQWCSDVACNWLVRVAGYCFNFSFTMCLFPRPNTPRQPAGKITVYDSSNAGSSVSGHVIADIRCSRQQRFVFHCFHNLHLNSQKLDTRLKHFILPTSSYLCPSSCLSLSLCGIPSRFLNLRFEDVDVFVLQSKVFCS